MISRREVRYGRPMTSVALFELILGLRGAALLLSRVAGRLGFPPAATLVLGGMALAVAPGLPAFDLDPDLILVLFLPPLLLASAYFTVWRDFRAGLGPILPLSLGAVVFTTLVVGLVAHAVLPGLPWAACFALGAIVSPPVPGDRPRPRRARRAGGREDRAFRRGAARGALRPVGADRPAPGEPDPQLGAASAGGGDRPGGTPPQALGGRRAGSRLSRGADVQWAAQPSAGWP